MFGSGYSKLGTSKLLLMKQCFGKHPWRFSLYLEGIEWFGTIWVHEIVPLPLGSRNFGNEFGSRWQYLRVEGTLIGLGKNLIAYMRFGCSAFASHWSPDWHERFKVSLGAPKLGIIQTWQLAIHDSLVDPFPHLHQFQTCNEISELNFLESCCMMELTRRKLRRDYNLVLKFQS